MTFKCGNCSKDNVDCVCGDGPAHMCKNCGQAPSTKGSDDCLACVAAYLIIDPSQMALIRSLHPGTEWLRSLDAEVRRQLGTPLACGRNAA